MRKNRVTIGLKTSSTVCEGVEGVFVCCMWGGRVVFSYMKPPNGDYVSCWFYQMPSKPHRSKEADEMGRDILNKEMR